MIDTKELRRLAQAATPGPWIAKNISGAGLEIYMSHPVYPDKEWPAFGTDSAFCKKGLVSYETWTQFPHEVQDVQQSKNAEFIAAANPAVINELLDRLEESESDCLEQARLNGMGSEREAALMAKLEAAEKERDALRALVVMRFDLDYPPQFTQGHDLHELTEPVTAEHCRWFVAEIERLRTDCDALRAKIEAMERQEPVASVWRCDNGHIHGSCERTLPMGAKLYALPGAKGE